MAGSVAIVTLDEIREAADFLKGLVHRTPMVGSEYLNNRIGARIALKLELFQKTGSFKVRGVLNKLNTLTDEEKKSGVVSLSAGNHAQSLAYAATQQGIDSIIVMPAGASRTKIAATEGYGGKVHLAEGDLGEATDAVQRENGLTMVHSFDDLKIIAGAGTVGLEILEDEPDVDVVVAGIGGGGLISGVAAALKLQKPSVRVVGVEPEGADGISRSLEEGYPVTLEKRETVADGLAAPFAGEYTLAHVQKFVDEVIRIPDKEILEAMVVLMERCKLVVEPAAAACVAALLSGRISVPQGSTVACIISGGNVGVRELRSLLAQVD